MEMSLKRFGRGGVRTQPFAPDVGMLLAGIAARQAASPTSNAQAALNALVQEPAAAVAPMIAMFATPRGRYRRAAACFNSNVAASLTSDKP